MASIRLDVWLWAARFFKTRSLAKLQIESHRVMVGGQACKASRSIRVGDALRIQRGDEVFDVEVRGLADKRGSASVAQTLYYEADEARAQRMRAMAERAAARAGYQPPASKPDKRARRLIQALGDFDAW